MVAFTACDTQKAKKQEIKGKKIEAAKNMSIFNEAKRDAQKSYPTFLREFDNKKKSRAYNYSIRMSFQGFNTQEFLWLENLRYEIGVLNGIVSSDPKAITDVKKGDKLAIVPSRIVDWMFIKQDTLHGGYTIKVTRDQLTGEARKKFDKNFGFVISDKY